MPKMKTKKEDKQSRKASAVAKKNTLLISPKLLANLRNKGIIAFKQMTDDEQKEVWKWSKGVIRQYKSTLEADPSNIRNIKDLPFPKEDIQLAIKLALPLYISKDMQSAVKMLKTAYKEIGTFQVIENENKKELLNKTDPKHRRSFADNKTINPLSDKHIDITISEQKVLLQEINDFVNDLEAIMRD